MRGGRACRGVLPYLQGDAGHLHGLCGAGDGEGGEHVGSDGMYARGVGEGGMGVEVKTTFTERFSWAS